MSRSGRRYLPQDQVRREKIQPQKQNFLPKHFETELRAFVSEKITKHNLRPEDAARKLREVAKSWETVSLDIDISNAED